MKVIPKNKTGGVVTTTVLGVGSLVIAVIIILVITTTLFNANLFDAQKKTTTSLDENVVNANVSARYGNNTLPGPSCSINSINNATTYESFGLANYTISADTCTIKFKGSDQSINNSEIQINSTTTYYGDEEQATKDLQTNFTSGIDNVSEKVPTILLIVAVVFLFGALVLLVRNARSMGIGSGGSL